MEHNESQASVQRFAQCDVSPLSRSPDLVVTSENFLDFFRAELVPLDMGDIVIVPLKAGNGHTPIVAACIYNMLQRQGGRDLALASDPGARGARKLARAGSMRLGYQGKSVYNRSSLGSTGGLLLDDHRRP